VTELSEKAKTALLACGRQIIHIRDDEAKRTTLFHSEVHFRYSEIGDDGNALLLSACAQYAAFLEMQGDLNTELAISSMKTSRELERDAANAKSLAAAIRAALGVSK
jgi:hypothetical protein